MFGRLASGAFQERPQQSLAYLLGTFGLFYEGEMKKICEKCRIPAFFKGLFLYATQTTGCEGQASRYRVLDSTTA